MSIEDLRDHGVLLPEEEWGTHRLGTTIRQWPLLISFLVAVASLVAAYAGDGSVLTWTGVAGFFIAFFSMVGLCDRAIRRQRRRVQRERHSAHPDTVPHDRHASNGTPSGPRS